MKFEELATPMSRDDTSTIVIVKNERYQESLELLKDDLISLDYGCLFFPLDNTDLFETLPEELTRRFITYPSELICKPGGYSYGEALLNAPRMRPSFILTEHTSNPRSLRSGAYFGIHLATDTPMTEENSDYPVDVTIRFSVTNGWFSFALPVEGETIEDSIRSLQSMVQPEVRPALSNNLQYAYMDGKRWRITPDQIRLALDN